MEGKGRVVKQIGSCGYYAEVDVGCNEAGDQASTVAIDRRANDPWHRREGWIDASLVGAEIGMKLAKFCGTCSVRRIHGMPCDTTPRVVAIATIRAVWAALGFVPSESLAKKLEACVLQGELSPTELETQLAGQT